MSEPMSKSRLWTRCWPVLAAYIVAAYVEALSVRLFLLREGVDAEVMLQPRVIWSFVLSPILFPLKYAAVFRVRSFREFESVLSLDVAPLVTFAAAFIGAYLLIRNRQRETGRTLGQD